MRGGGQMPFGIFPKIHPFWRRSASLMTMTRIAIPTTTIMISRCVGDPFYPVNRTRLGFTSLPCTTDTRRKSHVRRRFSNRAHFDFTNHINVNI